MDANVTLWLYVILLAIPSIVAALLLLYILRRWSVNPRYRRGVREYLIRLFPGAFGGLFIYIMLKLNDLKGSFQENLPSAALLVMGAVFIIVIGFPIFYIIYSSPEN